jgi:hypothetical protein
MSGMRRIREIVTCLMLLLATVAFPGTVRGDAKEEARKHYDRAIELVDDGQLPGAVIEFQRAYDLTKNFSVLYNIGQVYVSIAKPVEAISAYEAYLVGGGRRIPADRRADVEREIARQRARVATLVFRILPDGATVRVDGNEIGKTPLAQPLLISVGEHVVSAAAQGHEPVELKVTVAGEDRRIIELALSAYPQRQVWPEALKARQAPTIAPQMAMPTASLAPSVEIPRTTVVQPPLASPPPLINTVRDAPTGARTLGNLQLAGIISSGVGLAGLAVGTTCYLIGKSRHEDAVTYWKQRNNDAMATSYQSQAKDYTIVANINLIAGGALAALGTVLYIVGEQEQPSATSHVQVSLLPTAAPGFAGINAGGTW